MTPGHATTAPAAVELQLGGGWRLRPWRDGDVDQLRELWRPGVALCQWQGPLPETTLSSFDRAFRAAWRFWRGAHAGSEDELRRLVHGQHDLYLKYGYPYAFMVEDEDGAVRDFAVAMAYYRLDAAAISGCLGWRGETVDLSRWDPPEPVLNRLVDWLGRDVGIERSRVMIGDLPKRDELARLSGLRLKPHAREWKIAVPGARDALGEFRAATVVAGLPGLEGNRR